jgi:hypothetical protein
MPALPRSALPSIAAAVGRRALQRPPHTNLLQQVRMNLKTKSVELRTSEHTEHVSALQKSADFLKAFLLGFEVQDAIALLRLDDLYVDTFEVPPDPRHPESGGSAPALRAPNSPSPLLQPISPGIGPVSLFPFRPKAGCPRLGCAPRIAPYRRVARQVKDVKPLHGDHLSRAIGRIAGKAGKTKFAIENATRTRIVVCAPCPPTAPTCLGGGALLVRG